MQELRKQIIIKHDFQHRLILGTLLAVLISLNVIITVAFLLDRNFGQPGAILSVFNVSIAIMELIAVVIVFFISRRISFRIAGPVYAIERTLGFMAKGDVALRLRLREGDQFTEVADAINVVLESYQQRLSRVQAMLERAGELSPHEQRELADELEWFKTQQEPAKAA